MPWTLLADGTLNGLSAATVGGVIGAPPARFYITGDAHRRPPFLWATRAAVSTHFTQLMAAGRLCLHVEQQPEDVSDRSVPDMFDGVFRQQRVFGWELSMFRDLLPVMTLIMEIMDDLPSPNLNDVVALDRELVRISALGWRVGNPRWMKSLLETSALFKAYWMKRAKNATARDGGLEDGYLAFLNQYNNLAMGLRTDANNFIAANIQRVIAQQPADSTHLITVGNAHITTNPVQNYLNIGAQPGYVDASQD